MEFPKVTTEKDCDNCRNKDSIVCYEFEEIRYKTGEKCCKHWAYKPKGIWSD